MNEIEAMRGDLQDVYSHVLLDEGMKAAQAAQKQRIQVQAIEEENLETQNKVNNNANDVTETFANINNKLLGAAVEKHAYYRGK